MTPTQHQRIKALFLDACQRPEVGRSSFLSEACAGDARLKSRVQSLLALDDDPAGLESAAERVALRLAKHSSSVTEASRTDATAAGNLIPGYSLGRELHRGGQGQVYEAIQHATHRRVAIKVMRERALAGAQATVRFEREIQILAQLRHPNIVTIHDSGQSAGLFYFVMDYIDGRSLDDWILERTQAAAEPRSCKLNADDSLQLFVKICDAVNAAHLRGVIHRDLKPTNIRLDSNDEPHVLDFGLAKLVTSEIDIADASCPMTVTGQFHGSVPWASPEQAEGAPSKIDTRTDVYSLGIILYQMLTGTFPYDVTGGIRDVLDRIMQAEPRRPSSARILIDDEISTIVLKCLNKQRERRYQTAGELARDIRRYLAGEAIEAKRDSSLYVLRKQLRRHRTGVAVAATFLIVVAAAFCISIASWRKALVGEAAARQRAADADRRYAIAREGADLLLFGICTELPKLAGSGEMQKDLVEKARTHYERLAAERPNDPNEQRGIWVSLATLGESYDTLGDADNACRTYERVVRMVRDALAIHPDSVQFQSDLSKYSGSLGWILMKGGDIARAEPFLRDQWIIAKRLTDAEPGDTALQFALAQAHHTAGILEMWKQHFKEAGACFRKQLAIVEPLSRAQPENVEHQNTLSEINLRLGDLAWMADDMKLAEAHYAEEAKAAERLVTVEPHNPHYQSMLSDSYEALGQTALRTGDRDKAGINYRKSLEINERLAASEPKNHEYQSHLAKSYACLGELNGKADNLDEVLAHFGKSLDIFDRLDAIEPDNPVYLESMAVACDWLAYAEHSKGRLLEASAYAHRRTAALRHYAAWPAVRAEHVARCARIELFSKPPALRDLAAALDFAKKAVELSDAKDPKLLETLARAYHVNGDNERAVQTQKQAISLLTPGDSPKYVQMQTSLAEFQQSQSRPPAVSVASSPEATHGKRS